MLQTTISFLLIYLTCIATASAGPNVLFILSDDHSYVDLGSYGSKDLTTPHLDKLAKNGVRFTQFYSSAPVCCPSRAGILTGKYPWHAGVPGNIGLSSEGMPSREMTMAEYFRNAGYTTAHLGKWHLGNHKNTLPNGQGFDYSFGHHGGCIDNYSHYFYWDGPNKHDLYENGKEVFHPGKYFPHLMRDKALDFTSKAKKPFFIYYALNLPHYPYQAPTKWISHYANVEMPRRLYAASISAVDESIGQLLAGLDKQGKLENTIIVFMADHGHSTEQRAFGGGGNTGGLRGAKFSLYEGGIRVPAIISSPKILPKDKTVTAVAMACDWLPTLLDYSGIIYNSKKLTGKSLRKVITDNAPSPHHHIQWKDGNQRAVRKGNWKLLENPLDTTKGANQHAKKVSGYELYDLGKDREERNNLSTLHPEILKELKALLPVK